MKWQLFLALGGPARAIAGLEPIGEPQWNDGVICYTYLSTYLVPVAAEPVFPTLPSFPTTRGIVPPYFSNRSTLVPPSAATEASEMNEDATTVIDITTSDFPIPTDDQDPAATATGSGTLFPPTSATSTEAAATSTEAASGQAVIFFVSPQTDDKKRDMVKRAPGGFIGGDSTNVDICTNAGTFRLAAGQLFDLQDPIYYNGEPYKEFRSQGTPPTDAVTRQFSDAAGTLVFASRALPNTNAGFCQEPESGQVYITFTSSPPGCVPVSLRVYSVEQCQDGRIIGLDPAESATTEPNQSSTIAETINTASTETATFPEDSSSTALTGQTSSVQLSQSSDSFPETTETTPSLGTTELSIAETTTTTSDSPPEGSSSLPSFSLSSSSTETPLSFTSSVETSITSQSFSSLLSSFTTTALSESFSSPSTISSDSLSSTDILASEPTSSLSMDSSTESAFTSEVSTAITEESKATTKESTTATEVLTATTEVAMTTTKEPTTTITEEPTTTTTEESITTTASLCNSVDPLTTVALPNPTPVFNDNLYHGDDFASIMIPWGTGLAGSGQNTVYINTNGYITLDSGNNNPFNENLPTGSLVNRAYLPYWDDLVLDPSKGHTIVYEIFDSIFGEQLTVEFILGKADSPGIYHFEASFLEGLPGALLFRYYTTPEKGSSATAGFQDVTTGNYALASFNQADRLLDGATVFLDTSQTNIAFLSGFDNTECGKGQDRLP